MVFGDEVDFYSWQDTDNVGMEACRSNETVDQLPLLLGKREGDAANYGIYFWNFESVRLHCLVMIINTIYFVQGAKKISNT